VSTTPINRLLAVVTATYQTLGGRCARETVNIYESQMKGKHITRATIWACALGLGGTDVEVVYTHELEDIFNNRPSSLANRLSPSNMSVRQRVEAEVLNLYQKLSVEYPNYKIELRELLGISVDRKATTFPTQNLTT
jgi:hypothetical protein